MSDDLVKRLRELEAKLAKAVESFIRIDDLTCHNMPMTALKELKGETDE